MINLSTYSNRLSEYIHPYCPICKEQLHDGICMLCEKILPYNQNPCLLCGKSLTEADTCCGECQAKPPAFDKLITAFDFNFPVRALVHAFKYRGDLCMGQRLSQSLANRIVVAFRDYDIAQPQCLIPMPLHPKRQRERGFNQAIEIAAYLSKKLNMPLNKKALKRIRPTMIQAGLNFKERRLNVKAAFEAQENLPTHVALVDDVVTTGATIEAAAKALQQKGVEEITVFCIARSD